VWGFNIVPIVTSTGRWKLEGFNAEWEVLIIGVIDKEPVVDGFLETLCFIASWHKWTGFSGSCALLNASSLGQSLIMSFNTIDNDSPLSISVNSTEGLNVSSD